MYAETVSPFRTALVVLIAPAVLTASAYVMWQAAGPNQTRVVRQTSLSEPADAGATGSDPVRQPLAVQFEVIGQSVRGRLIERIVIGDGPECVLYLASIHGNEAAGTPLLRRLLRRLQEEPELLAGRRVVLLPVVNPDGVAAGKRYNARGIDLNRNFPAENRQNSARFGLEALSEPEAVAVYRTIDQFSPSHIITLHEPLNCVDYDGPGEQLAQTMSEQCPLPVRKLGSRPGSLGSFAGVTLGIPTVTFELPRNARELNEDQLWALYGRALVRALQWRRPPAEITVHRRPAVP